MGTHVLTVSVLDSLIWHSSYRQDGHYSPNVGGAADGAPCREECGISAVGVSAEIESVMDAYSYFSSTMSSRVDQSERGTADRSGVSASEIWMEVNHFREACYQQKVRAGSSNSAARIETR